MTLVFGLVSALLLGAVGLGVYLTVAAALLDGIDSGLQFRAATLQAEVTARPTPRVMSSVAPDPRLAEPGEAVTQVFSTSGALLQASPPARTDPVLPAEVVGRLQDPTVFDRRLPGIANVTRLLAAPVPGQSAIVVVGASMQDRADTLRLLTGFLAAAGPLALLVACAAGWRVAGAALGPVDRMRRQAVAVAASDLDRRLSVPPGEDEISRLARTLNGMLDRLQQSFQAERRFLDTASHELRTPLATLRTELDLALARPRSLGETRAALVSASEETDRLARLAEDLLVLSRANQGRLPLHRTTASLRDLVTAATAQRWRSRATAVGVRLVVDAEDLPVRVDPMRLRQALDNLLDNGLRHSPSGGVLAVHAYVADDKAWIVVTDDGPGFPEGARPPRASPWSGSGPLATGLGLTIVRAVTEAHVAPCTWTRALRVARGSPSASPSGTRPRATRRPGGQVSTSTRTRPSVPPRTARSETSPMPRT
jgi:signal transduction histidine kinase